MTKNGAKAVIFFYRIFVYEKAQGGIQRTITIPTDDMDAAPVKIAYNDGKIYVISNRTQQAQGDRKAIRVFNTSGVEQTTEGLDLLIADITDVAGFDADGTYFYILDSTDNKVYVFNRADPLRRRTSLEFDLDNDHTNPTGLALSEFETHIIMGTDNKDFVYYNPRNILWASSLFIEEKDPYNVISSETFWVTPERSEGEGGTTTIIQQTGGGGGGSGTAGTNGNSVTLIFRRSENRPTTPTTSEGTYSNGSYSAPPSRWATSVATAEAQAGTNPIWLSFVHLSGDGTTILRYEVPIQISDTAVDGDSLRIIYNTAASEPTLPSGGTWVGDPKVFTLPSINLGWTLNAQDPDSLPSGQNVYISVVTLPGEGTDEGGTITYAQPQIIPRGRDGNSTTLIFRRSSSSPTSPALGTWNGVTYTPPTDWTLAIPGGNEPLYAIVATLGPNNTVTQSNIIPFSGIDGQSISLIYRRSNTELTTIPSTSGLTASNGILNRCS